MATQSIAYPDPYADIEAAEYMAASRGRIIRRLRSDVANLRKEVDDLRIENEQMQETVVFINDQLQRLCEAYALLQEALFPTEVEYPPDAPREIVPVEPRYVAEDMPQWLLDKVQRQQEALTRVWEASDGR